MSERYWINGVQLGLLSSKDVSLETKQEILSKVCREQFIGNYYTPKEQKWFKKEIKKIKR